jgi:hypothetical protein
MISIKYFSTNLSAAPTKQDVNEAKGGQSLSRRQLEDF